MYFGKHSQDKNYEKAIRDLLDRYGVEKLGLMVAEQIKSRLHPDDLNDLWRQYWAEELPNMETVRNADPQGYRSWVDVEFNTQPDQREELVKDWSRFAHLYFQYLGDQPPSGRKRIVEEVGL